MRHEPTEAERRMWSILRDRRLGGFKFRRQEVLGAFIVDFLCPARSLVIEIDGSQHSESQRDERRDPWLRAQGYEVLRFWNSDVLGNPAGVQYAIATRLGLKWEP